MSDKIKQAIKLLRADIRRDIYTAVDGLCYVTYSPDSDLILTKEQCLKAEARGLLKRKWTDIEGCWIL